MNKRALDAHREPKFPKAAEKDANNDTNGVLVIANFSIKS